VDNLLDAIECRGDGGLVTNIGIDGFNAEPGEIRTPSPRRVVERSDRVPALNQLRNQVCSDEAVCAGDENPTGDQASSRPSARRGLSPMSSYGLPTTGLAARRRA
jgi:hypothetical protein